MTAGSALQPTPFTIAIPNVDLAVLRQRLLMTRFPPPMADDADWSFGADPAYLRELVRYWIDDFDWRAVEAFLNAVENFTADVDGVTVHFVHTRGAGGDRMPLLLLHGWPGLWMQMLELSRVLTEDGGFDTVIPSLPGFGFSSTPNRVDVGADTADRLHRLMTEGLGYPRYAVHGTDFGANVADHLAHRHPESVIALHVGGTSPRGVETPPDASPAELSYLDDVRRWRRSEVGYGAIQSTKPQSLAAALVDSPVGCAAWLVEKYRRWSDCGGNVERRFRKDQLLAVASVYWFTGTIATSIRAYAQSDDEPDLRDSTVPIAYLMSSRDMLPTPREWAARRSRIDRWTAVDRGGHFIEWEEPVLVADDIRQWLLSDAVSIRR